ncbi:MAG: hypothetical protein HY753_08360 [Nitrospirae bacterium]|nr:hypothetical protein [Nitrospirota bacterium]
MSEQENIQDVVMYWIGKAKESLDSAYDEMTADRLSISIITKNIQST